MTVKDKKSSPNDSGLNFETQLRAAAEQAVPALNFGAVVCNGRRPQGLWLPPEARRHTINAKAKSPEIGKVIDDAMGAIERENPTLKGVLPRDYARPSLDTATRDSANPLCESHPQDFCEAKDHVRLGGLVDIISNIGFNQSAAKSKDVLSANSPAQKPRGNDIEISFDPNKGAVYKFSRDK